MRRRFGRGRRGPARGDDGAAIDADHWLRRIAEGDLVRARSLAVAPGDGVSDRFAVVGTGTAASGERLLVGFSPRSGADAALAAVSTALRLPADESADEVVAISPRWSMGDRRRIGLFGALPFALRSLEAPSLAEGVAVVEPVVPVVPWPLSVEHVAAQLPQRVDRELFRRAALVLEGLASKHGGAVRGVGCRLELILMARCVAALCAEEDGVALETDFGQKSTARLDASRLADTLDSLEGQIRKRLGERRSRDGEDGLRARAIGLLVSAESLGGVVRWPLPGAGAEEPLDIAAAGSDGLPVVAAVRKELTLARLGSILDGFQALRTVLPVLLGGGDSPYRAGAPRLILAAESVDDAVKALLPFLAVDPGLYRVRSSRFRGVTLEKQDLELPVARSQRRGGLPDRTERDRPERDRPERDRSERDRSERERQEPAAGPTDRADARSDEDRDRPRRRGGRRRGRRPAESTGEVAARDVRGEVAEPAAASAPRYEELSLFDLDDDRDAGDAESGGGRGRGRRRGRSRGRSRGDRDESAPAEAQGSGEESGPERPRRRGRGGDRKREADASAAAAEAPAANAEDDVPDDFMPVIEDLPELVEVAAPGYDEEEDLGEEVDPEEARRTLERETQRRARAAKAREIPEEKPKPRRRAAVVARGDRDSVLAAVLLARDVRLLEGFWVYPQEELMTFFRSVATDLRPETPIYLVGFEPRPARDVTQAAALYGQALTWFDHHDWPPEDREAVRQVIGDDGLHLTPGAGSSVPGVLATCTRRSRFTDKLVDLGTARFSKHDYERWGRLWASRIAEIASRPGDRRADVEPLLAGRPSDLAAEAAAQPAPPAPEEVRYVSERDFRLVYFGGYALVVVEVPPELDVLLCARIARERYGASLSLALSREGGWAALGGDEQPGRRSLDFGGLIEHLAAKHAWVEVLADGDHVARFRIHDLAGAPERLDEVIGEIAMGRSLLEG